MGKAALASIGETDSEQRKPCKLVDVSWYGGAADSFGYPEEDSAILATGELFVDFFGVENQVLQEEWA